MAEKFKKLRSLGDWGTQLANLLVFLTTNWGLVVSVALGILTVFFSGLFDFFNDPRTQVAIGVFLAALWTYVGIRVLRSFGKPIHTLPETDYRYCISPEGIVVGIDPKNPDLHVSVLFALRNVGNWPLHICVEKFDLRIEDRAAQEPDKKIQLVIPRFAARTIKSGGFKKDVVKDRNTGTLNLTILYGDPDGPFVRKYSFKTKLHFIFNKDEKGEVVGGSVTEELSTDEDSAL